MSTALEAVEEHSTGPTPQPDTIVKRPQPMLVSTQGDEEDEADEDDDNGNNDEAAAGASQPNPAPKQRSSASQGQPAPSRPPNIPRCVRRTTPFLLLAVKHMLCILPVDVNAAMKVHVLCLHHDLWCSQINALGLKLCHAS